MNAIYAFMHGSCMHAMTRRRRRHASHMGLKVQFACVSPACVGIVIQNAFARIVCMPTDSRPLIIAWSQRSSQAHCNASYVNIYKHICGDALLRVWCSLWICCGSILCEHWTPTFTMMMMQCYRQFTVNLWYGVCLFEIVPLSGENSNNVSNLTGLKNLSGLSL